MWHGKLVSQICKSLSIIILPALKNIQLPHFAKPWLMDSRFRGMNMRNNGQLPRKRESIYCRTEFGLVKKKNFIIFRLVFSLADLPFSLLDLGQEAGPTS
jgi:hypothetical protein